MECLGEMIWNSQRDGLPPDADAYIDACASAGAGLSQVCQRDGNIRLSPVKKVTSR